MSEHVNVHAFARAAGTLRGLLERLQMRIDPDTCRDADLLAAEVQRLRAVNTIDQSAYGGDIVQRLRNWRGLHLAHGGKLFEQAADEIERLRLTDAERQAIKEAADAYEQNNGDPDCERIADTLYGLLDRLGGT